MIKTIHPRLKPKPEIEQCECEACGETFDIDNMREVHGRSLCDDCFNENYCYCASCDTLLNNDDTYYSELAEESYCSDCYHESYFRCVNCESEEHAEDGYYIEDEGDVCRSCYEEEYFQCEVCDNRHKNEYLSPQTDRDLCLDCYKDLGYLTSANPRLYLQQLKKQNTWK